MNVVKQEEAPTPLGFSATRLGLDKALEKQRLMEDGTITKARMAQVERH